MKKVILGFIIVASISITSCKKSYNCTCYDINGNTISSSTIKAGTLTEAQTNCAGNGTDCAVQ